MVFGRLCFWWLFCIILKVQSLQSQSLSSLSSSSSASPRQLRCPKKYQVIPKIPPPKLNRSSSVSKLFTALNEIATFDGSCYYWSCKSHQYVGTECKWCLPHVMIAGFSKCGTTAFCNKLARHPEIKRYKKKEVNILTKFGDFSWETLEIRSKDPHPEDKGHYWMDCSSGAFRDLQVVTHLRKYSPQTKIIFLVRDPWQRIGSYIEMIKRNSESTEDYNELLDRLKDKIRRHGVQPDAVRLRPQGIKHLAEVNNFMFIENILVWMSVLEEEQLLVIDHYDLEHSPMEVMRRAESFLGLKRHNYSQNLLYAISSNAVSTEESFEREPTANIHPPYSIHDKKIIQLSKRLFIPSLCLFEAVFGWPVRIVTPEILKSLPTSSFKGGREAKRTRSMSKS